MLIQRAMCVGQGGIFCSYELQSAKMTHVTFAHKPRGIIQLLKCISNTHMTTITYLLNTEASLVWSVHQCPSTIQVSEI